MFQWYHLHPIIAPLPKGFMDNDPSHKEAKKWMLRATDELDRMAEWIDLFQSTGIDYTDYIDIWADAALKGWTVDDLIEQRIDFSHSPLQPKPQQEQKNND
jgi:hypothetical protein